MKGMKFAVFSSFCLALVSAIPSTLQAQQIPNITRGEPGTYITGPTENPALGTMGRLAVMGALGDYVVTIPEGPGSGAGSTLVNQLWDLSDLENPREVTPACYMESNGTNVCDLGPTFQPYQAHGTLKAYRDGEVVMDIGGGGGAFLTTDGTVQRRPIGLAPFTDETTYMQWNKSTMHYPWSGTTWGSYGAIDRINAQLYYEMQPVGSWDHLGLTNIVGMPNFMGDLMLFVSDQANDGVASYDVSDPANPRLLDVLYDRVGVINPNNDFTVSNVGVVITPENESQATRIRTIGGYWQEISGHYVVIASRPNDIDVLRGGVFVIDFEDPENLRVHCYIELDDDPMYVNFQDEHVFTDRWKVDIEECRVEVQFEEDLHDTEMSQYALPLGNVVAIGGIEDISTPEIEQGMSIWVHQSEPDLRPPYVAYHIPQDGRTNFPTFAPVSISIPETLRVRTMEPGVNIIVQEVGGEQLGFDYRLSHAGMLTINPDGDWPENATIEVTLTGIQDYMRNAMETYSFRFSTGSNVDGGATPPPVTNNAPTINSLDLSPASPVFVDRVITVTASASDSDGDALTYTFDNGIDPPVQTSSASYSFSYANVGDYSVQVTVSDPDNATDVQSIAVSVVEEVVTPPNQAPVITAVDIDPVSLETLVGESFTVTVSASDPDIESITYQLSSSELGNQYSDDGVFTLTYASAGTYVFDVIVFDSAGAQDSQRVTGVTVTDAPVPNRAPSISSVSIDPSNLLLQVGETAVATVNASDPDGDTLTYIYDDGVNPPVSTTNNTYSFSYDSSAGANNDGRYFFRVRVEDPDGESSSRLSIISVYDPVGRVETPNASSQIDFDLSSGLVWSVNPDNASLVAVDPETNNIAVSIDGLADPHSVLVAASGLVWVTSTDSDQVHVYTSSGSLVTTISTGYGSAPFHVIESHDGQAVFVSLFGSNEVLKLDANSYQELDRLAVSGKPRAMAISENDDLLLVTRFISTESWGEIWAVNPADMSLTETIKLLKSDNPDTISNGRGVPNYISSVVIAPGSQYAYYAANKNNTDLGLVNGPTDLDDDNSVRAMIGKINLATLSEDYAGRFDSDNRESPSAMAIAPTGDHLLVSMQGKNEVVGIRIGENGVLAEGDLSIAVGFAPQGLVFDLLSDELYVKNFLGRSISRIGLESFLSAGQSYENLGTYTTVSEQDEVLAANVLNGKRIFYFAEDERMSAEGYISCATCHIDGTYDGRTWDFTGRGEGLRNTTSLVGRGGPRFGRMHWSGNFDEVQDFEHDIRNAFLGEGFIDTLSNAQLSAEYAPLGARKEGLNQDLDDMAAYVESLGRESLPRSPFRADDGSLTSTGLAGQQIFNDLNCEICHADSAYTDGVSHDVGTIRSFSGSRLGGELSLIRTPSLLGVFDSAPYLHDGSAAEIEDVFRAVGGNVYAAEDFSSVIFEQPTLGNLRGNAAALLTTSGETLTFSSVDGGRGGDGLLRVRGAAMQDGSVSITLIVNGTEQAVAFDFGESALVGSEQSNIVEITGIGIELIEDASNVISFRLNAGSVPVLIDDITVSTPENLETAEAHLVADSLSDTEKSNLVSFIKQLDRAAAPSDDETILIGHRAPAPSPPVGSPDPEVPVVPDPEPEVPDASQGEGSLLPGAEEAGAGSSEAGIILLMMALLSLRLRRKIKM